MNAEKLERFASIPEEERRLAENLLFNSPPVDSEDESLRTAPEDWREQTAEQKAAINQWHIGAVTDHFRKAGKREKQRAEDLPLDQRLANYIIEGTKDGLIPDLERKRAEGTGPLEIINGPLMAGMNEVGRLFNNNELIVAEVLQSAEAMKAAVNHLEQFMEKSETAARGKVILATVKGDVHDIGKNLVEIILANNGYEVVNLGIKVPPDILIRACQEHRPDAIGLSGLLVKSTQQMVITATDMRSSGIGLPLLVGGAALSEKFTRTKIAPAYGEAVCYAKDAMTGLSLMNRIMDPVERENVLTGHRFTEAPAPEAPVEAPAGPLTTERSSKVRTDIPIPAAPYLERKVRDVPHLAELWSYINPFMLYGRHLGYKGNFEKALADREDKALELYHNLEAVKQEAARFMKVKVVWQFFEAERDGNAIHLFATRRRVADPHLPFRTPAPRQRLVPERLHPGSRRAAPRSPGDVRGDRGLVRSRALRGVEAGGRILQGARHPGAGHRDRRRNRRVAAPAHPRRLGISPIRRPSRCTTASPRSTAANATASATRRAPIWTTSRGSGSCSSPIRSACV